MASKPLLVNLLSYGFSTIAFLLTLLVLLGGSTSGLANLFYLKTDTTNFDVPSKLSNSSYLVDLSTVAAVDYTGADGTAASLGLAQTYTISLLASCAEGSGIATSCSAPRVGYSFSPASDLRLDSTSLQGTYGAAFLAALSSYQSISHFAAIAYIISAALIALAALVGPLSTPRRPALGPAPAALSLLATALLFAASVATAVASARLSGALNTEFAAAGLSASLGSGLFVLSFLACLSAALAAAAFWMRARGADSGHWSGTPRRGLSTASRAADVFYRVRGGEGRDAGENGVAMGEKGVWSPTGTTKRGHRYVQIEKQGVFGMASGTASREAVFEGSGDDAHGERGIPMRPVRSGRVSPTPAYEPYSSAMI